MQETKDIIPKLEMEKAKNALDEAKILFDSEKYYGAANRSYYAAFHAMSALLIYDGYSMKKHSGVISKFRELYIKTGIFETEVSEMIAALFKIRTECDYDTFYVVAKADVEEQIKNAELILELIEKRLEVIN
ncbi:antitoxin [Ruminococcus albus SY3]|uniref:Antitoxin n=1 Tax=Ruminococcus albus SY3 TaxID=1341156 RepID=A0A011VXA2_RUMAL|nr:HEPN domain-containing protein [Ruminococcus albus]EXM39901.1 antitoxin [Ruminococcus albus SY3]